ncbi:hypothetical protein V5799_030364 [Amblyomma americanum]|uniref:Uncharacterized protein n=1 Tax=Amblyomma americanum TaxID=6943 RepID=A0AAQ4ENQ3_AMBAM
MVHHPPYIYGSLGPAAVEKKKSDQPRALFRRSSQPRHRRQRPWTVPQEFGGAESSASAHENPPRPR